MCSNYINESFKAMKKFLSQTMFSYVAKMEEETGIGYVMVDLMSRGNHIIIMRVTPENKKLFFDYYPGIRFFDIKNVSGHRVVEIINTYVADTSLLVTDSRELLIRGVIDLNYVAASDDNIRNLYQSAVYTINSFGDILEECLVHPQQGADYLLMAKARINRLSDVLGEGDHICRDIGGCVFMDEEYCTRAQDEDIGGWRCSDEEEYDRDDDDDVIELEPEDIL